MTTNNPVEPSPAPIDCTVDIESEDFSSSPYEGISTEISSSRTLEEDTRRVLAERLPDFGFDKQEAFVRVVLDEAISKRNPRLMIALLNRLWPQPRPTAPPPAMVDAPIKIIYLPQEAKGTLPDHIPQYTPQSTIHPTDDDEQPISYE